MKLAATAVLCYKIRNDKSVVHLAVSNQERKELAVTESEDKLKLTRKQARELGLKRYFTGVPCVNGHLTDRQTLNGTCVICSNYRTRCIGKRDRAKNRKKHAIRTKKYKDALKIHNPAKYEQILQRKRNWYNKNKEKVRVYDKQKRSIPENKIKKIISEAKRRAKKINAGGFFTPQQISDMFAKQKGKCINCFVSIKKKYEIDHIIPICKGGSSWISNIQLLCPPCNHSKNSKDPIQWAREKGRLL